jgi:hypothetical protein
LVLAGEFRFRLSNSDKFWVRDRRPTGGLVRVR